MTRILVGVDFSDESDVAIEHAVELARRTGAVLTLAHVTALPMDLTRDSSYDPFRSSSPPGEVVAQHGGDASHLLAQVAARCRELGIACEPLVVDDSPSDGLARAADEVAADLLVVGSHGRSGLQRVLLGSVAERTIRLSARSSLVARGAAPSGGAYRRIVVATDFSVFAEAALPAALAMAAEGAHIDVVHCWQTPVVPGGMPVVAMREDLQRDIAQAGARLIARHRTAGIELAFLPVEQAAAEGVRAHAEASGCELIVVGSHGRRGVRRALLGSVAEATVRLAPCSVLVARPAVGAGNSATIAA